MHLSDPSANVTSSTIDDEKVVGVPTRVRSRLSGSLVLILVGWLAFGSWVLFAEEPPRPLAISPWLAHVCLFIGPTICLVALVGWTQRRLLSGLALLVAAAAISEFLQELLGMGRALELVDFAANLLGIAVGSGLAWVTFAVSSSRPSYQQRSVVLGTLMLLGALFSALFGSSPTLAEAIECTGRQAEPQVGAELGAVIAGEGRGVLADDSRDLRCDVLDTGAFSVAAVVMPESGLSSGPTRIVTSSNGWLDDAYNFHLGQHADALSVRVRTGDLGNYEWHLVRDVFTANEQVRIVLVIEGGLATVVVNGDFVVSIDLESSSLSSWDPDYPIIVGDEVGGGRRFEGAIGDVAIFDRALTLEEAASWRETP